MKDPTRQEMLDAIHEAFEGEEAFDVEMAIYWFAANYHDDMGSNLYEVLSDSQYIPGPMEHCVYPDSPSQLMYDLLEERFA